MDNELFKQLAKIQALEIRAYSAGLREGKRLKELELKKGIEQPKEEKLICPECGEESPNDERVRAGMKCTRCAYP